ncbi:MAG: Smr/MutS family protein [Patescibacteria group bacterium]
MNEDISVYEIDLHGLNMFDAKMVLDEVFEYIATERLIRTLHIVVGIGKGSEHGPVLPAFVGNYLKEKGYGFVNEYGVLKVVL